MYKIVILLFILPVLCNCKEQQPVPETKEICDSSCEMFKNFERSINKVAFSHKHSSRHYFHSDIVVTKTGTGAFAKYDNSSQLEFSKGSEKSWKAEFSAKEWQDFIRALYNLRFNEWQKEYKEPEDRSIIDRVLRGDSEWSLSIFSPDKKEADTFSGKNKYPPNWEELAKIMEGVSKKIIVKTKKEAEFPLENKLKMEYEKKFGEPISDFEISTKEITFRISKEKEYYRYISITRTETGAILRDGKIYGFTLEWGVPYELELSSGEWLDFMRALHKSKVDEWEKKYESNAKISPAEEWELTVHSSNEDAHYKFSGKSTYPSNWKQFKKTMDDMMMRIRKIREAADGKLKAEHQKKFGSPISDFDLSIRSITLHKSNEVTIFRTPTGVVAKYSGVGEMELSLGEWLDIIKILHNWRGKYNVDEYPSKKWKIQVFSLEGDNSNTTHDKNANLFFGGDTYPPNWDEFEKTIANIRTRILKAPYVEIEKKLEAEYQKRFGEPISEFELSIKGVELDTYGVTSVSRTETGAEAYYFLAKEGKERMDLELTTEEWLDFIRLLRKYKVDEWKEESIGYAKKVWRFNIYFIDGMKTVEGYYDTPLPNWKEFKKTMDNMQARIKAEPARKKAGVKTVKK
jgi:hypothetical protein